MLKKELAEKITDQNIQEILKGKIIGVQAATTHDRYVSDKLAPIFKSIERYNTQDEANLDLASGRIDVTLAGQAAMLVSFLETDLGKNFSFASPIFNDPDYYGVGISIAIRKGDEKLKNAFNQSIKNIRQNGEYKKINDKYFSFDIY